MKRKLLVYSLNAFLVVLTLFLAYRVLSPSYERKETVSLSRLGLFHTHLAAERLGAKLGNLREELKENGLRLVDPSRGPVTLDSSRWLWLRIQDRDWRAPKYLEALPKARIDIDTWGVAYAKDAFVISERIPILKEGVQDFVLLEGGLKPSIFQDLQTDPSFGVWVFDMKAYEKGGLGAAKLYERSSSSGALSKDEIKLLTSDMLMQLFRTQSPVSLDSKMPWMLTFKNASGPSRLGVLGYWLPEAAPANLMPIWLSLAGALLLLSVLFSFLILKSQPEEEFEEEVVLPAGNQPSTSLLKSAGAPDPQPSAEAVKLSSKLKSKNFEGLFEWIYHFSREFKNPLQDLRDRLKVAYGILSTSSVAEAQEVSGQIKLCCNDLDKSFNLLDRLESYFGKDPVNAEAFDVEVFFKELLLEERELQAVEAFFEPDVWSIYASKRDFTCLLRSYLSFLTLKVPPDSKVHFTARFVAEDAEDVGSMDICSSPQFKAPFVRLSFYMKTNNPIGRMQMAELFDLEKVKERSEIELALTQKTVLSMGGRLRVKSSFEDGNVILLDIPAHEERKAEDKVNSKHIQAPEEDISFATSNAPGTIADKTEISSASLHVEAAPAEDSEEAEKKPTPGLAQIEKANSFAEGIVDERSRVRSRFRIRKPGEK
ncbi:MAG: hypothetical protein R3A80_11300 [Bdellovibrionota bacterium]